MSSMDANKEVEHYTELAQIALTWIQTNNNPNAEERERDQQLLYSVYGKGAVMTGFQVALGMLLRHGANAEHIPIDDHIKNIRKTITTMKNEYKIQLKG